MLVFTHPDCAGHDTGQGHPEAPARLLAALDGARAAGCETPREAPLAEVDALTRAHPRSQVERILRSIPESGLAHLDPDTVVSAGSALAARRAAGAACAAVDAVLAAQPARAFCAVRPPGHHAEEERAMGFCLFNSIAVAAHHAFHEHGLEGIAILDFDVHHGNGTQDLFRADGRVRFTSSHQSPLYPFSGEARGTGIGNIKNVPLPAGTDGEQLMKHWRRDILPWVREFEPQLILVSAGFDAHRADPLAQLGLVEQDFFDLGQEIRALADDCCQGRLACILEGGYDLNALRDSIAAYIEGLEG